MMYSKVSLQLILINDTTKQDDMVSIRKNLTYNEFDLTYTENSPGEDPHRFRVTGLSYQGVLDYVHLLLKSQYVDDEPYTRVQVNSPATPRLIISAEKLKEVYYREHLYDMVSAGLGYLETATVEHVVMNPLKVKKAVKIPAAPKKVAPAAPLPESEGEIDSEDDVDYYEYKTGFAGCKQSDCKAQSKCRSAQSCPRPQHLFWD